MSTRYPSRVCRASDGEARLAREVRARPVDTPPEERSGGAQELEKRRRLVKPAGRAHP